MNFNTNAPAPMGAPPPMGTPMGQPLGAPAPMGGPVPMGASMNAPAPAPMGGAAPGVVSLAKGQKVSLSKMAPALKRIMVGLGWDTNKYSGGHDFDLDASAFLCDATGRAAPENFIFYNNLRGLNDCCIHQGDNLTGDGDGDDEQILIDLDKIPANIDKIAITVTIFEADKRRQNFGNVSNAFIRLVDDVTGREFLRYDLGEDYSSETALVVAEVYRRNGEWKFNAIGSGFNGGLAALCANFGIQAAE